MTLKHGAGRPPHNPAMPRAVLFDLLTALLDSWTLWDRVAGGAEAKPEMKPSEAAKPQVKRGQRPA